MFTSAFTKEQFETLTESQQEIILALAKKNGALENQLFDEELADICLGLFEPADRGDVLPSYFLLPTEVYGYLSAKIRLIYETAYRTGESHRIPRSHRANRPTRPLPGHSSRSAPFKAMSPLRKNLFYQIPIRNTPETCGRNPAHHDNTRKRMPAKAGGL